VTKINHWSLVASLLIVLLAADVAFSQKDAYKRVHQDALAAITSGNIDKAVQQLHAFAEANPQDGETHFMLTVAHAQQGNLDLAWASLERAVQLGIPEERFIAGPRELLAAMHGSDRFRQLLARHAHEPIHGPLVGTVTDRSARVWVRTALECDVRVVVSESKDLGRGQFATGHSLPKTDYTAVVEINSLSPDTLYYYAVEMIGTQSDASAKVGSFRTFPAAGKAAKFRLAFGGGAGFVPQHERMWDTIGATSPDMMLLLGDNVYSDAPKNPHMQRYCYYRRQSRGEFRSLMARTPIYTIWDDHDFGTNDCWGGPEIETPAWKRPVWNVYRNNWVNPSYGGGERQPGVWYTFSRGDVQFFMLDGRYYRTDPKIDSPSMLGPVQLAWLEQELKKSTATFKVICSPVPWDYRTKGDSRDTWNGFRQERDAIFSALAENQIEGVLLMSADRHRSDAWRIERPDGYDLYEFNSSRLTNQHVHKEMPQAVFSYNGKQSFGLVDFDTTAADPTVTYTVMSIDGEAVHSLTLKRSQLTHAAAK